MELKKGMRVQLKAWKHADDTRLSIMDAMKHHFGRVVTIATDPDGYRDFQIVDGDGWCFTEDWVAAVIDSRGFGVGRQKEQHKDIRLIRLPVGG